MKKRRVKLPPDPLTAAAGALFRVGRFLFDPKAGAGATPYHQSVDYHGIVVSMTPNQFLGLNPPLSENAPRKRYPPQTLAPPQLYVAAADFEGDEDEPPKKFRVRSHEGRHRMRGLVEEGLGDAQVQVYVYPSGFRSRDLEPVEEVTLLPDPRSMSKRAVLAKRKR